MIKRDWKWVYSSASPAGVLTATNSFSFKSRSKARFYNLNTNQFSYGWKRPQEETLGPSILTTWSK